jgi:hypothetical protein
MLWRALLVLGHVFKLLGNKILYEEKLCMQKNLLMLLSSGMQLINPLDRYQCYGEN